MMEPAPQKQRIYSPAARAAVRRYLSMEAARQRIADRPTEAPRQIGRPAGSYRGARRNAARTLGRMPDRQPGQHPWWIGIQPNARMRQPEYRPNASRRHVLYDRDRHHPNPKGKGFSVWGAMANFFFTPAARRAAALMMGLPGFRRR